MVWIKSDRHLIRHRTSLETPPERLQNFITPNEDFFVCNMTRTVTGIDPSRYRLKIGGDAVGHSLSLSLEEIKGFPSQELFAYLECAGNMRRLFTEILGHELDPYWTRWRLGGVGMAHWRGVSLREVLALAEIRPGAIEVNLQGLDDDAPEGGVNRPIPIEKALDPDTILAYEMNGAPLPADHGYPLRAIVPGWVGTNSVKWLGKITISSRKFWVERNTTMYVMKGDHWPADNYRPAEGGPITTQNIKSSLSLKWNAHLKVGRQTLRGFARSPHGPIRQVEWSDDHGQSWWPARLIPPFLPHAWTAFEFDWAPAPGAHTLMTRATDETGHIQPLTQPINEDGYLFNMVYPHPVIVASPDG